MKVEQWFRIPLSATAVKKDAQGHIMKAFDAVMPEAGSGCALFTDLDSNDVFISPDFAKLAPQLLTTFNAVECDPPSPRTPGEENGTALLLASDRQSAWKLIGN